MVSHNDFSGLTEDLNLPHTLAELTRFLELCCKPLWPCNRYFCMSTQHHIGNADKFCCLLEIHFDSLIPQLQWPLCALQPAQGKHFQRQLFGQEIPSGVPVQSVFKCIHNSPAWSLYCAGPYSQSTFPTVPGLSVRILYRTASLLNDYICLCLQTHPCLVPTMDLMDSSEQ